MILLIFFMYSTNQTLIYQFDAISNIRDGWQDLINNVQFYKFGGIQNFGKPSSSPIYISRIFIDLESHSHINMNAEFLTIDQNNSPYFEIDRYPINQQTMISSQLFDNTQPGYLHTISITLQHYRRTAGIYISTYIGGGLRSLRLNIIKCQFEQAGCIEYYHTIYLQWKLHQYQFNYKLITNSDGWTFVSEHNYPTYFQCGNFQFLRFKEIKYSTQLPPHQDVVIQFQKIF